MAELTCIQMARVSAWNHSTLVHDDKFAMKGNLRNSPPDPKSRNPKFLVPQIMEAVWQYCTTANVVVFFLFQYIQYRFIFLSQSSTLSSLQGAHSDYTQVLSSHFVGYVIWNLIDF